MGAVKQLLQWHARPLLQHVIDRAARADEIVVVLGHAAADIEAALDLPAHARVVTNERWAEGQATSLRAGLHGCSQGSEAALVLLGDNPTVEPGLLDDLTTAWRASAAPIVRTRYADRPGHPVLLARSVWSELDDSGDEGARTYMQSHPDAVHDFEVDRDAPVDVDDPTDYDRLLRP